MIRMRRMSLTTKAISKFQPSAAVTRRAACASIITHIPWRFHGGRAGAHKNA
jgi:hypothetical protein